MGGPLDRALRALVASDASLGRMSRAIEARFAAVWNKAGAVDRGARLVALTEAADAEIETLRRVTVEPVPCQAGCNHCCAFQEIVVSGAEAARIVAHVEQQLNAAQRDAVCRSIAASGTTGADRNTPCALLTDEGCSVYTSRPMPCRSYHSTSEPACRACRSGGAPYPTAAAQSFVTRAHLVGMVAIKVSRAYDHTGRYEINALLRRIYADPAKVARWAAGHHTEEPDLAK